ncbi:MAG: DnaJ domain-containing protein [Abditibacteriota bacterium]|nr:DnaJ domain-containing protein [Abditibacteriota bacterium]
MANRTFYEILNIEEDASLLDIKTHYHKLARLYHPDITKLTNTHDKFIEINEAYRTLKDPILRKAYDFGLRQRRDRNNGPTTSFRAGEGNVSVEKVDLEQAQKAYKAKTAADLANIDTFKKKALSSFANGSMNEALYNLEECLKIDDQQYEMWKMRGDIYLSQQNYDLSMESYSKACKINDNPEIRAALSSVISLRQKVVDASKNKGKKNGGLFGLF